MADQKVAMRRAWSRRAKALTQWHCIIEAKQYAELFHRVEQSVLPDRKKAAENEEERNTKALAENPNARVNIHHANFLKKWWQLSYGREDMIAVLAKLPRYVVCSRVTKRPIFEFVDSRIRPNDALQVFPYADDYSFGLLQSGAHWAWILGRCSTLKSDFRYTSNTVFDSFPWPQLPTESAIRRVADAAVALRGYLSPAQFEDYHARQTVKTAA